MKVIKLNESDIKRIVKRVIKEDTDECNTSKDYYIYINNIGNNRGKTKTWEQFWGNVIRKLKDDNGIDTTKENVCACLKQNDVYKSHQGKYEIKKMCTGKG